MDALKLDIDEISLGSPSQIGLGVLSGIVIVIGW
jgi:hypothetical protein